MLFITQWSLEAGGINLRLFEDFLKKGISFDGLVVIIIWDSTFKRIKDFKTFYEFSIKTLNAIQFRGNFVKFLILGVNVVFKLDLHIFFTFNFIYLTFNILFKNISESLAQQVDICLIITWHCFGDDWLDRLHEFGLVTNDHASNLIYILSGSVSTRLLDLME